MTANRAAFPRFAAVSFCFLIKAVAQTPTAARFEVASIKPAENPGGKAPPQTVNDASHYQHYNTLGGLMRNAYKLEAYQKTIGPAWLDTTWFEIVAKIPEGATKGQIPEMLRALPAERFGLSARMESKEETVYLLSVANGGPKLKEAAPDAGPSTPRWVPPAEGQVKVFQISQPDGWIAYSASTAPTSWTPIRSPWGG